MSALSVRVLPALPFRLKRIPIGPATIGACLIVAGLVAAGKIPSENQKLPLPLIASVRPAPEPIELYWYVCVVEEANPALQPSINPAGKDAPDPIRSTALAGVARTNESDRTATAAFTKRAFII